MRMQDLIESGRRCDISANTIRRLCQLFPAAKVDDGLALLYIEQRRVAIHNPTGWLQAALRRGFTTPRRGRNESADVRQQRRQNPALRGAGEGVPVHAVLTEDTRFQKTADQTQHALVGDATADTLHERVVVDLVETRGDVRFEYLHVTT